MIKSQVGVSVRHSFFSFYLFISKLNVYGPRVAHELGFLKNLMLINVMSQDSVESYLPTYFFYHFFIVLRFQECTF